MTRATTTRDPAEARARLDALHARIAAGAMVPGDELARAEADVRVAELAAAGAERAALEARDAQRARRLAALERDLNADEGATRVAAAELLADAEAAIELLVDIHRRAGRLGLRRQAIERELAALSGGPDDGRRTSVVDRHALREAQQVPGLLLVEITAAALTAVGRHDQARPLIDLARAGRREPFVRRRLAAGQL